jgi:hypothetical protein
MNTPLKFVRPPTGIAFEIADLLLLQGWATFHQVRMAVELDQCVDGEEYEEVVALYAEGSSLRRWNLWRTADTVVVQPLIGRACRFDSVTLALDAMSEARSDGHTHGLGAGKEVPKTTRPRRHAAKPRRSHGGAGSAPRLVTSI